MKNFWEWIRGSWESPWQWAYGTNTQRLTEHLSSQRTSPASLMTGELTGHPSLTLQLGRHHMCRHLSTDTDTSNTCTCQVRVLMDLWDLTQARFHLGLFHPDILTAPFPKLSGIVILDSILHSGLSLGGRLIPENLVSLSSSLVQCLRMAQSKQRDHCLWWQLCVTKTKG